MTSTWYLLVLKMTGQSKTTATAKQKQNKGVHIVDKHLASIGFENDWAKQNKTTTTKQNKNNKTKQKQTNKQTTRMQGCARSLETLASIRFEMAQQKKNKQTKQKQTNKINK